MIPITDKIFFIEGKSHGRYIFSNSLYIEDDQKAIIDTGTGKSALRKLKKNNVGNNDILIINSHVHEDHICGNYIFRNSKIAIHRLEVPILENIDRLAELYGIDDPKYKEMNEQFFAIFNLKNYKVDIKIENNHIFDLGEIKLQTIHAPGHCAGHCMFWEPSNKILFLADIDLSSFGPWYGDISSSVTDFIDSINKAIKLNPDIAISSHKGVYKERIREKLKIFLDKIYEREGKILNFLERKHTLEEIVKQAFIYGKFPEPEEMFAIAERIMVKLHINRLLNTKKIEENPKYSFIAI